MNRPSLNRPSFDIKSSSIVAVLKNRTVMIALVAGLFVVLIWFVAFFSPQGKDLTKYKAQESQLQTQQAALQAQLTQLRATSNAAPQLEALQSAYVNLIPTTADIYNYINLMSTTATSAGVHLVSITPSSAGTPVAGTSLQAIPISLITTGTYDTTLAFIKSIYSLPRLTVINSMTLAGGGPGTNRGTSLSETYSLTIYTTAKSTP
jgi:Tfp pilus assembly protein PilO